MSSTMVHLMVDLETQYKKQDIKTSMTWLIDESALHEIKQDVNLGFRVLHHESYDDQIMGHKYRVIRNYQRRGVPLVALIPTSLLEGLGIELLLDNSKRQYERFYESINRKDR